MFHKLTPELKEKWCQALESGEFEQGYGGLARERVIDSQGNTKTVYCCLGVLAKVADFNSISEAILRNVHSECEFLSYMEQTTLYGLNDGKRLPFPEIAKYIREHIHRE